MKLNQKIIAALIGSALISPVAMARTLTPAAKAPVGHIKVAPVAPGMKNSGTMKKAKTPKKAAKKAKRSHRKGTGRRKSRTPNRSFGRHARKN